MDECINECINECIDGQHIDGQHIDECINECIVCFNKTKYVNIHIHKSKEIIRVIIDKYKLDTQHCKFIICDECHLKTFRNLISSDNTKKKYQLCYICHDSIMIESYILRLLCFKNRSCYRYCNRYCNQNFFKK